MTQVTIALSDEIVAALRDRNQPLDESALEMIVLELYRRGDISSGKAAELLGRTRWEFVRDASRLGLPFFDLTADEWAEEFTRSREV